MGGQGSGRRSGFGRNKVEASRFIDANRLHREGCLQAGWSGIWHWTRDGERTAWINLRSDVDALHLSYRVRISAGDWEDIDETIRIARLPCRFGGERPYFLCPGVVNGVACMRRVVKLHCPGRYFLCRHCYRMANASQSEDACDRSRRRVSKIKQSLGGDADMPGSSLPRPKGMWTRTYERLQRKCLVAESLADTAFVRSAEKFLGRRKRSKQTRSFWQ